MQRKTIELLLCIALMICLLAACGTGSTGESDIAPETEETVTEEPSEEPELAPGLFLQANDLPTIDEFSSTEVEKRDRPYPNIVSVRYYADGTSTELPADDGRVIRLLNFISKSFDDGSFGIQYGYEEYDEIMQWYSFSIPMLEVTFERASEEQLRNGATAITKLLICGSAVLYVDDARYFEDGLEKGELYWPYVAILGEKSDHYFSSPGEITWIDFLVYAGFDNPKPD